MLSPANKRNIVIMSVIKLKCECGEAVSAGSVFCPYCMAEIMKKNAKTLKREEKKHQIRMKEIGRKRKK